MSGTCPSHIPSCGRAHMPERRCVCSLFSMHRPEGSRRERTKTMLRACLLTCLPACWGNGIPCIHNYPVGTGHGRSATTGPHIGNHHENHHRRRLLPCHACPGNPPYAILYILLPLPESRVDKTRQDKTYPVPTCFSSWSVFSLSFFPPDPGCTSVAMVE